MSNSQTTSTDPNEEIYVNLDQARTMVEECLVCNLVPITLGSPGMGKSAMYADIAKEYKLKLIDLRLSQFDPTDLNGFPAPDYKTGRSGYLPPEYFPLEGDPVPAGYEGWMVLLDELPSASLAVQAAAYKLILDRMVGMHKLHPKVRLAAAGNLLTDNAIVNELSTAMQSRIIHILVKSNLQVWVKHAEKKEVAFDGRLISFCHFLGKCNDFNPEHSDNTFMCERTLEFAHKLMKRKPHLSLKDFPLLAGTIGKGPARELIGFCQVYAELPTFNSIVQDANTAIMPKDKAALFALTGMLSENVDDTNLTKVLPYILRMDIEFQVIALRSVIRKYPILMSSPEIMKWSLENAQVLVV